MNPLELKIKPIGFFKTSKKYPYDAPKQGVLDETEELGIIELDKTYKQGLISLEGFEKIWVLYHFHHNENWNLMVNVPRGPDQKIGVFATRAPYRPNPIGISVVDLIKIEENKIFIQNYDLLDGTPIVDIKPYVPYADAFPDAKIGWLENIEHIKYEIQFSKLALLELDYLSTLGLSNLKGFLISQLEYHPTDKKRKRVKLIENNRYQIAYRTWRTDFEISDKNINVLQIKSGYNQQEIQSTENPYQDKELHKKFLNFQSELRIKI